MTLLGKEVQYLMCIQNIKWSIAIPILQVKNLVSERYSMTFQKGTLNIDMSYFQLSQIEVNLNSFS